LPGFSVFQPRFARVIRVAMLLTAITTGGSIAILDGHPLAGSLLTLGAVAYVITTVAAPPVSRALEDRSSPHHVAVIAVDLLIITAVVWLTGGVRSEYYLLYYGPLVYAAIRASLRDGIAASLLAAILYAFVGFAQGTAGTVVTTAAVRIMGVCVSAVIMVILFAILTRDAQAHDALREHLHDSLRRVSAVYDVAHAANTGAGVTAVLSILLEQAALGSGASGGSIALLTSEGQLQVTANYLPKAQESGTPVDPTCTAARQAIAERAAIIVAQDHFSGTQPSGAITYIYLPLLTPGGPIGVLGLAARSGRKFRRAHTEFLEALCGEAATAVENVQLRTQLRELATTDHLTGLLNRRETERRLAAEVERASRYERPLTVVMLDIDDLKEINDRHGHAAGDRVICLLGRLLRTEVRGSDVAGRVGGDEFLVVLPEAPAEGGTALSQRLIARFQEELRDSPELREMSATVGLSAGVASSKYGSLSSDQLLSRADAALYTAKRAGRNRTCTAAHYPDESAKPYLGSLLHHG